MKNKKQIIYPPYLSRFNAAAENEKDLTAIRSFFIVNYKLLIIFTPV